MAPPREMPGSWGNAAESPRRIALAAGLALIVALSLLALAARAFLPHHSRPSELDSQIEARLAELGVQPTTATAERTADKALGVRRALAAGDFATANRITADVLAHSRMESWRYYPFEDFLLYVFNGPTPQFGRRLDEWVTKDYGSALPYLLRARYLSDTGSAIRGTGFAAKVEAGRMTAFGADLAMALGDVNTAIRLEPYNPYSYYLRLRILRGYGMSQAFMAALGEAITRQPTYYPLYEITLDTLQPRWGGSIDAMYNFVDKFAGTGPQYSPLRLLYLSLYRHLLGTASLECGQEGGNSDRTVQCIAAYMQKAVRPGLEQNALAALQLYDHTDKYEFGIAIQDIISGMLATSGGDSYSGTMLQLAATSMHSDTQLAEDKPGHNDYIVDELAAQSWYDKGYYDNEVTKYREALSDARATEFPKEEERNVALAAIYEHLSEAASQQHHYAEEIAYEKAALLLGVKWDEHYICHGYYELGKFDEAVQSCSDAIAGTDNAYARYWRGEAYNHSGRFEQALADLTSVADSDNYFAPYAAVDMSMIYFNRKDNRHALDVLNKYTFLYDPDRTERSQVAVAYNNRCYAYMKLGFLKKALGDCTQSLKYGSIPDAFRKEQELIKSLGAAGRSPDGNAVSGLARSL
jgi:tetratricopeptide (TPR) repeat protein